MKKITFFAFLLIILSTSSFFFYLEKQNENISKQILNELSIYDKIEKKITVAVPIYIDYNKNNAEKKLRKYLFKDHIEVAKRIGVPTIKNQKQIDKFRKKNLLSYVDLKSKDNFFFYNVQKNYRYLTPTTLKGLKTTTDEIQKIFRNYTNLKKVSLKIAISSALRPTKYQTNLRKRNNNATIISTHSYGTSFDIFYDDYYLSLPEPGKMNKTSKNVIDKTRQKIGFILGDSLRRQFKTILHKTLIKLQNDGLLYAIHEKKQRCYHVTIRR